jgi:hypothetical protein
MIEGVIFSILYTTWHLSRLSNNNNNNNMRKPWDVKSLHLPEYLTSDGLQCHICSLAFTKELAMLWQYSLKGHSVLGKGMWKKSMQIRSWLALPGLLRSPSLCYNHYYGTSHFYLDSWIASQLTEFQRTPPFTDS